MTLSACMSQSGFRAANLRQQVGRVIFEYEQRDSLSNKTDI
jgi:hypothetical protein